MKQFFNKIWEIIKSLFDGRANKHQKWLTYGTLVFGLIISLLFGTIFTALLMYVVGLLVELTYCYVPMIHVYWLNHWFKVPDFKGFLANKEDYLLNPSHNFKKTNLWFIMIAIVIFIPLRLLFLIF